MRYTSEQYEKAKNVNLVSFLQERGYELKKDGLNSYKLKQETGFTISNNLWCWHSQGGIGGNAIDFLVKYEKMPLVEAVLYLSGDTHVLQLIKAQFLKAVNSIIACLSEQTKAAL